MRIPSAGTPIGLADLLIACTGRSRVGFSQGLGQLLGVPWCQLAGSGTSALYASLRVLAARSSRREVLLPAYTAPSLVLPVRRAGLEPVLADVSLETFNAGAAELMDRVGAQTLAVVPVHMFGLPMDVQALMAGLAGRGITVVEDACSAMGAEIGGAQVGTLGEVGFYSFNRGKNLSTVAGGALVTANEDLVESLEAEVAAFEPPGLGMRLRNVAYAAGLAVAVRPMGYTILHPFLSGFKYTTLHTDFHTRAYTGFQSRLGQKLLRRWECIKDARARNASFLRQALADVPGVTQAEVMDGTTPVHNQYPILAPDQTRRDRMHAAVCDTGLEATVLYPDPIHRIYPDIWDGVGPDPFPNATDLARRLVLIPVHPLVPRHALERAVDAIAHAMRS